MKKVFLWVRFSALIAAVIMIIVAVAFSWFNNAKKSNFDEVDSSVVDIATNGSQISYVSNPTGWFDKIDVPNAGEIAFKPVTGNGEQFFKQGSKLVPVEGSAYSVSIPDGFKAIDGTSTDYLTLDYKIKNLNDSKLYLDASSYVVPASLTDGAVTDLADFCAGAIRVCISQKIGDTYVKKLVWVPNTSYQMTYTEADGYTAVTDGETEDSFSFRNNETDEGNLTIYPTSDGTATGEKLAAGVQTIDGVVYLWGNLKDIKQLAATPIGTCAANAEEHFRLTIWLDGTDRECNNAVIGGAIKAMLTFNTVFSVEE